MNREETIALFYKGREEWNSWAASMLAQREQMQKEGRWQTTKTILGDIPLNEAAAWTEEAKADFSQCVFEPIRAIGCQAQPKRVFYHNVENGFSGFVFPGEVIFSKAVFESWADFKDAIFHDVAKFDRTVFKNYACFGNDEHHYENERNYKKRNFSIFKKQVSFKNALFKDVSFCNVQFEDFSGFYKAIFGRADFHDAVFRRVDFNSTKFEDSARFTNAKFFGKSHFKGAEFGGNADFDVAKFSVAAETVFDLACFRKYASFAYASFDGPTSFYAIRCESGFTMADATFKNVPDFIQAHFEEAPRLDNLKILQNKAADFYAHESNEDSGARWRALKRLAIQSHDIDRELDFNAHEIVAKRRLLADCLSACWLVRPLKILAGKVSASWIGRFWADLPGFLYGLSSDFGRSLLLPLTWWLAAVAIGAAFYLSQTPALQRDPAFKGAWWPEQAWQVSRYGLSNTVACYTPQPTFTEKLDRWKRRRAGEAVQPGENENRIGGLIDGFRDKTSARAEALHLAFRNAFIVLDGSSEAAHRTYGCLYGVELYGGSNPVAVVPSAVSTASAVQKLFSALMIFLFGLALRNMLKVK